MKKRVFSLCAFVGVTFFSGITGMEVPLLSADRLSRAGMKLPPSAGVSSKGEPKHLGSPGIDIFLDAIHRDDVVEVSKSVEQDPNWLEFSMPISGLHRSQRQHLLNYALSLGCRQVAEYLVAQQNVRVTSFDLIQAGVQDNVKKVPPISLVPLLLPYCDEQTFADMERYPSAHMFLVGVRKLLPSVAKQAQEPVASGSCIQQVKKFVTTVFSKKQVQEPV